MGLGRGCVPLHAKVGFGGIKIYCLWPKIYMGKVICVEKKKQCISIASAENFAWLCNNLFYYMSKNCSDIKKK